MTIKFKRVKILDSPRTQEGKTLTIDEEIKYKQLCNNSHFKGFLYVLYTYFLMGFIPVALLFLSGGMIRVFETAFKIPITQEIGLSLLKGLSSGFEVAVLFFNSFKTTFWTVGLLNLAYSLYYNHKLKEKILNER